MFDQVPPPFGDVTRRWTQLTDDQRAHHVRRLLLPACPQADHHHVDRPAVDDGRCYAAVARAAAGGDPIAFAWLAASHRSILLSRGQALFEHDCSEWGAVCLEGLQLALERVDLTIGRWLRRRFAQHVARHVSRTVERHLALRRREIPTAPTTLHRTPATTDPWSDPHPDLSIALDRALGGLDAATRDALLAVANRESLAVVANRHALSYDAVRQRVSRARRRLQPELASFVRSAA